MKDRRTEYEIRDPAGRLVATHVRIDKVGEEKKLWWERDGQKGLQGLRSAQLPLYGAHKLGDVDPSAIVYLVEGEKPQEALDSLGVVALGTVTGANGTPALESLEVLRDTKVVLWPDADSVGRKHMDRIGEQLVGVARSIRWLEPEGMAQKDDAFDWIGERRANGHSSAETRAELDQLVPQAPPWKSKSPATSPTFNLTDLGNAERLVSLKGEDLHYCHPWRKWLIWDGKRWRIDDEGRANVAAKETVRSIYEETAREEDELLRKATAKHANRSESAPKIRAMLDLARSELRVPVLPSTLDHDTWLLNVENGTIDLRDGQLREHRREDLITKLAPVRFDLEETAPTWLAFLDRIMAGDTKLIEFLQRAAGYALTGSVRERCLFIAHGSGANGKTTYAETLLGLLGDYGKRTTTETLLAKRPGGIPNDLAALKGARFVVAAESDQGRRLAEATVKDLTGGDTISARFMRAEWFEYRPEFKIWLSTNHKPEIHGTDNAIWDRIRLIPFEVTISPEDQDRDLLEKLRAERPGILAWAVKGCLKWLEQGLHAPEAVANATGHYRAEMDVLGGFIADRCLIKGHLRVAAGALYEEYKSWCEESGERPVTQRKLGLSLGERGLYRQRSHGKHCWYGIGLADRVPDGDPSIGMNELTPPHEELSENQGHQGALGAPEPLDEGTLEF
ncbi:MAG: DNA primase [Acidobacteria bacterium]|nr:DNA primase [Acidobacteriota bacterium]